MKGDAEPAVSTCYWWHDPETGEKIVIPGCWARVQHPDHCSCNVPESRIERERGKRRAAEATAERLRDKLIAAKDEAYEVRQAVRHWIKVLRDHGIDPSAHNPK